MQIISFLSIDILRRESAKLLATFSREVWYLNAFPLFFQIGYSNLKFI